MVPVDSVLVITDGLRLHTTLCTTLQRETRTFSLLDRISHSFAEHRNTMYKDMQEVELACLAETESSRSQPPHLAAL